jgi:hypothetical protein
VRQGLTVDGFAGSNAWKARIPAVGRLIGEESDATSNTLPVQSVPMRALIDIPGGFVVKSTVLPIVVRFDAATPSSRRPTVPAEGTVGVGVGLPQVTVRQGLGSIWPSGKVAWIEIDVGVFMTNGNWGIIMLA